MVNLPIQHNAWYYKTTMGKTWKHNRHKTRFTSINILKLKANGIKALPKETPVNPLLLIKSCLNFQTQTPTQEDQKSNTTIKLIYRKTENVNIIS